MDLRLVYGFLVAMGLFIIVWFLFVVPSERRDHERRLEMVRKRIAEREQQLAAATDENEENNDEDRDSGRAGD